MPISVSKIEFFIRDLHTRTPFRYGIVTMTRVPHLIVRLALESGGRSQLGFSADQLPPKWFTKNPDTSFREDLADMIEVIRHAGELACALPSQPAVFAFWRERDAGATGVGEGAGPPAAPRGLRPTGLDADAC